MARTYAWRVGILGATGAVGRTFLECLETSKIEIEELRLFAREGSAGTRLSLRGVEHTVRATTAEGFAGLDLVLMSAGARAAEAWAPAIRAAGAWAVDNSSRFRLEPDVPLVVAEVNPEVIPAKRCLVANPNCSAMQLLVALKPLHDRFGLEKVWVATYQSASGKGQVGLRALDSEIATGKTDSTAFARPLHMNVIPEVGTWREDGWTEEEEKILLESRKILALPDLPLHVTCVRVPVRIGHSEAVYVETAREPSIAEVRAAFLAAPGIALADGPGIGRYPVAREVAGTDPVHIGRVRRDRSAPHGLHLWVVADNLRKGAALNAVQIAELLYTREARRG